MSQLVELYGGPADGKQLELPPAMGLPMSLVVGKPRPTAMWPGAEDLTFQQPAVIELFYDRTDIITNEGRRVYAIRKGGR